MDKSTRLAQALLQGIGGAANIARLENCMTRVRVEVIDESKLALDNLRQLEGIKGYVKQGSQHQFIAGPGAAAKVTDAMRNLISPAGVIAAGDTVQQNKAQAKAKYRAPLSMHYVSWRMCLSR